MNALEKALHKRAVEISEQYRRAEAEMAKVVPEVLTPEKSKHVAEQQIINFQCDVSVEVYARLQRIKDLLSQKRQRTVSLEEALFEVASHFLKKNDPLIKAQHKHSN